MSSPIGSQQERRSLQTCQKGATRQKRAPRLTLSSQVGLHALAILACSIVDVLSGAVRTNERDGLDPWLLADELDGGDGTVQNRKNTLGKTCTRRTIVSIVRRGSKKEDPPAFMANSAIIIAAPGSRSEGLIMSELPVAIALIDQRGIIAGKLNLYRAKERRESRERNETKRDRTGEGKRIGQGGKRSRVST